LNLDINDQIWLPPDHSNLDLALASAAPPTISPIEPLVITGAGFSRFVLARATGSSSLNLTAGNLPDFVTFTDLGDGRGRLVADGAHATPGRYAGLITATADTGTSTAAFTMTVPGNTAPVVTNRTLTTPSGRVVGADLQATDPRIAERRRAPEW
jgi:hypothetical protein